MSFIDLSHTIADGLETYPGLPAPHVCDFLSYDDSRAHYAEGTEFHIGRVDMVANTGTYLDAPAHRLRGAADVADLALADIADLPGVVIRARDAPGRAVPRALFEAAEVAGRAVLVETGWDRHFGTPRYGEEHPHLTEEIAVLLRDRGARLVGIDSLNIDDTKGGRRPVHTALLGAGIPIVEHLRGLEKLPDTGFSFFAVPPKLRGMGTFPVRAFARVG